MTWKTWGYGPVYVPPHVPHGGYTFPFDSTAYRIRTQTDVVRDTYSFSQVIRSRVWFDYEANLRPSRSEIVGFEIRFPDQSEIPSSRLPSEKNISGAFARMAQGVTYFTAAHLLSNLAAVIANFPMEQSAKDQLIVAIVMALPNFDDSEQLKSPVGNFLVRTRDDFMHAARSAEFQNRRTSLAEYLSTPMDATTTHTITRKP